MISKQPPFFSLKKVYEMAKNKRTFGGAIEKSILYNRNVLYFIFALALGYLFYMSTTYDYYSLSIFVIIGFLTSFFSKNMIVILSLAMSVSFIFKYGTKIRPEGFENENVEEEQSLDEDPVESYSENVDTDAEMNVNMDMNSSSNTNENKKSSSNTNMNKKSSSNTNENKKSDSNTNMNKKSSSNTNENNTGSANPLNSSTSMSPSTSTSKTTTGPSLSTTSKSVTPSSKFG